MKKFKILSFTIKKTNANRKKNSEFDLEMKDESLNVDEIMELISKEKENTSVTN